MDERVCVTYGWIIGKNVYFQISICLYDFSSFQTTTFSAYFQSLSNSFTDFRDDVIGLFDLRIFERMDRIFAKYLSPLDRLFEFFPSSRGDTHETHTCISIVCFTTNQPDFLHRKEESCDSRGSQSNAIREIDTTHSFFWCYRESVENEKIRKPDSSEFCIHLSRENRVYTRKRKEESKCW